MEWLEIIKLFGIPSLVTGAIIGIWQRRQDKRDADRERREVNREKMELFSLQELMAVSAISRATAEAVQRIPDAHCNGEVKAALEYERGIRNKQRDFLEELGIHALHDD